MHAKNNVGSFLFFFLNLFLKLFFFKVYTYTTAEYRTNKTGSIEVVYSFFLLVYLFKRIKPRSTYLDAPNQTQAMHHTEDPESVAWSLGWDRSKVEGQVIIILGRGKVVVKVSEQ